MCRGNVGRLATFLDVTKYLPDIGTVRDEGEDAHLATTQWTQEREY